MTFESDIKYKGAEVIAVASRIIPEEWEMIRQGWMLDYDGQIDEDDVAWDWRYWNWEEVIQHGFITKLCLKGRPGTVTTAEEGRLVLGALAGVERGEGSDGNPRVVLTYLSKRPVLHDKGQTFLIGDALLAWAVTHSRNNGFGGLVQLLDVASPRLEGYYSECGFHRVQLDGREAYLDMENTVEGADKLVDRLRHRDE